MSEWNQLSFKGGMNLLIDDTRLSDSEYRLALNCRNRYDELTLVNTGVKDITTPVGVKQELVTFGNYVIAFISGNAWFRHYLSTNWQQIIGFSMSSTAPRYWTCAVPVGLTNYVRRAASATSNEGVNTLNLAGASGGNIPGLLVQDNVNQPQFIYLDANNQPVVRVTQTFGQWHVKYSDPSDLVVGEDAREYVPIGNSMAWTNGILFVVSQDRNAIYRSVSGRPLDFVVNIVTSDKIVAHVEYGGGDAMTTGYSVGVGGITCLRALSDGSLFVSASNANFIVSLNTNATAPTLFGEYTFIRKFLFNATNLSDRTIIDSLGDTRFIDLTGVRSFNAIAQLQNEGRNSSFTANIQRVFKGITQDADYSAAILFDNYELYAVNTVFGPAIAVYDTLVGSWAAFDTEQTGGKRVKQFAKIELTVQRLFAITEDDEIYTLFAGDTQSTGWLRTSALNNALLTTSGQLVRQNHPKYEVKLQTARVVLNSITKDCELTITPFTNNRVSAQPSETKQITYVAPTTTYEGDIQLDDTNSMLYNALFSFPNCEHGWSTHLIITWTGGALSQYSMQTLDETPLNPTNSQS